MQSRLFLSKQRKQAFCNGYETKMVEIKEMGWEAAKDKFNMDFIPGKPWTGSTLGLEFAKGEFEALMDML